MVAFVHDHVTVTGHQVCDRTPAHETLERGDVDDPGRAAFAVTDSPDGPRVAEDEMAWLPHGADPFYEKYTPNNVLTEWTKTRLEVLGKPILIDGEPMSDFGLQLRQLAQVLRSHGVEVVTRVVDESADAAAVRRELAANLATGDDFVLVNYARRSLGQTGGGHISPLGAYDERSDSFLIMDVNPNRAPWVWVGSDDLIAAMRTFDTVENRGYLLVSEVE